MKFIHYIDHLASVSNMISLKTGHHRLSLEKDKYIKMHVHIIRCCRSLPVNKG